MSYDSKYGNDLYEVLDIFQEVGLPSPLEDRKVRILDNYYDTVDFRKLQDYFEPYGEYIRVRPGKLDDLKDAMDKMSQGNKSYILSHVDTGICGDYAYKPVLHGVLTKRTAYGRVKDILVVKLNIVTHTVEIDNWDSKEMTFTNLQQLVSFINRKWMSDFTLDEFLGFFYKEDVSYQMMLDIDDWTLMPEYGLYSPNIAEATFDKIKEDMTR